MNKWRKSLLPLSIVYDAITRFRNIAYDRSVFKSQQFKLPVMVIGNLSTGGTGKTPMVEYLLRVLSFEYKVAVLSRGYKRKSKGFTISTAHFSPETLGDEPFQIAQKFPHVPVAVDADRVHGIQQLMQRIPHIEGFVLDDAFQHRAIQPSFQILLTTYQTPWFLDQVLPAGNLREASCGKKRADVIVVTKCPTTLSSDQKDFFLKKLKLHTHQDVFFSSIRYSDLLKGTYEIKQNDFLKQKFILVTGIAHPDPLVQMLNHKKCDFTHESFPDHHFFSVSDIERIKNHAKPILTTEKDYVRLKEFNLPNLFYISIECFFLEDEIKFNNLILKQFVKLE